MSHPLSFTVGPMLGMIICVFFREIPETVGRGGSMLPLYNGPPNKLALHKSGIHGSSPGCDY